VHLQAYKYFKELYLPKANNKECYFYVMEKGRQALCLLRNKGECGFLKLSLSHYETIRQNLEEFATIRRNAK